MTEAQLSHALKKAFEARGALVIKHADAFTAGVPDLSITCFGHTSWCEVKFKNPAVIERAVQVLMCKRLAQRGQCWYVIYDSGDKTTRIFSPLDRSIALSVFDKYDHEGVVMWILSRMRVMTDRQRAIGDDHD